MYIPSDGSTCTYLPPLCVQSEIDACANTCVEDPDVHGVCKCLHVSAGDVCYTCPPGI